MQIRVAHLYPAYLNIYADRGNIAVLERRAAARGHSLVVDPITLETATQEGAHDLYYVGGGQDREQAMIAPPSGTAQRSSPSAADTSSSVAAIGAGTAPGCPGRASSRTRRSRASSG